MDDCVGTSIPLPTSTFQERYLPVPIDFDARYPKKDIEKIRMAFKRKIASRQQDYDAQKPPTTESDERKRPEGRAIVQAWVDMNERFNLFPGYIFHTSENSPDVGDKQQLKCDATLIAEGEKQNIVADKPNWALSRLPIEFKRGGREHDPFEDGKGYDVDATANKRRRVRGQLMSYARKVCSYQHRTKLFQMLVNGGEFRMLRWDHSGVIFTPAIDYLTSAVNMKVLLQMLASFTMLDNASQGLDHTAVRLPKDSCGWKRMDVLSFHHNDLPHDERRLPDDFIVPVGFVVPTADSSQSPLLSGNDLYHDPMATLSPTADHSAFSLHVFPVWVYVRTLFRNSLDPNYPRYQITMNGRKYLVAKPIFENHGMIGRGTRGYVALEWETQRFVFLKDAWRPYYEGVQKEGDILLKLNETKVPYVPTLIAHGDVCEVDGTEQETETSKYAPMEEARPSSQPVHPDGRRIAPLPTKRPTTTLGHGLTGSKCKANVMLLTVPASMSEVSPSNAASMIPSRGQKRSVEDAQAEDTGLSPPGSGLRHFVHYRAIVAEVCLPSTEFPSGRVWAKIVWHCLQAHQKAYVDCDIIHRDVSVGNILILPTLWLGTKTNAKFVYWTGVLTDWELAKDVKITIARQPERIGTWQFMSLRYLRDPTLPILVPDELESFFNVLLYNAVRFLLHNIDDTPGFVHDYFDNASVGINYSQGPPKAKDIFISGGYFKVSCGYDLRFHMPPNTAGVHPMNGLLAELIKLFCARYRVLQWEAELASREWEDSLATMPSLDDADDDFDFEADFRAKAEAEDPGPQSTLINPSPPPQNDVTSITAASTTATEDYCPTQEDYARAESINTHQVVIDIFARIMENGKWPRKRDTVPDRLFGYRQAPRVNPSTSDKPAKQAKTAPAGGPSARLARAGRGTTRTRMNVLSK